ncbi:MAG TPA: glycosyltransferase [Kiritimatiellia bacterium]|nr:glycosyltransferase [Kiritimatiellia bacterium]HMO98686.1 glycosyltransferase [Kiritimatiellia bacterium]
MSNPKVSICIGTYNREKYVRECLDSALRQTYPNIEVVVVDDASTDRTVEILREYGDRITLILRDTNSGICPITRNQAIQASTGTYVALLDSDDAWYPEKIERQVAFLEAHPDIPLCHTACRVIDDASRELEVRHEGRIPPTGAYFRPLLDHCWITISSVMMRRTHYDTIGPFNHRDPYGYLGEDHEFFLRTAARYSIGFLPEVLGKYRKSAAGITAGNWKAKPEPVPLFQAFLRDVALWKGIVPKSEMVEAIVRACRTNSDYWRHQGYPDKALWFDREALSLKPWSPALWGDGLRDGAYRLNRLLKKK